MKTRAERQDEAFPCIHGILPEAGSCEVLEHDAVRLAYGYDLVRVQHYAERDGVAGERVLLILLVTWDSDDEREVVVLLLHAALLILVQNVRKKLGGDRVVLAERGDVIAVHIACIDPSILFAVVSDRDHPCLLPGQSGCSTVCLGCGLRLSYGLCNCQGEDWPLRSVSSQPWSPYVDILHSGCTRIFEKGQPEKM